MSDLFDKTDKMLSREVYTCVSTLVSELIQDEKYMEDLLPVTIRTAYECEACGATFASEDKADSHVQSSHDVEFSSDVLSEMTEEALEHYAVSQWLYDKLAERGEMVAEFKGLYLWGRTCSGQAIALDSVMQDIAKGL